LYNSHFKIELQTNVLWSLLNDRSLISKYWWSKPKVATKKRIITYTPVWLNE